MPVNLRINFFFARSSVVCLEKLVSELKKENVALFCFSGSISMIVSIIIAFVCVFRRLRTVNKELYGVGIIIIRQVYFQTMNGGTFDFCINSRVGRYSNLF